MFQAGRYNAVCCRYITCSLKPPCCRNAHTLCLSEEGGQVVFTSSFGTHLGFRSSTLLPKDKEINAPPRKTLSQPCPSPKNSSKLQGSREARVTYDPKNKYLHFYQKHHLHFAYLIFINFVTLPHYFSLQKYTNKFVNLQQNSPNGHNWPKFCDLFAKKYNSSIKVHHCQS